MRDGIREVRDGIRAVFLDAGGTLFREKRSRAALYAEAARRAGVPIRAREMEPVMRWAHDRLPRRVRGHYRYSDGWFEEYIQVVFRRVGVRGDLGGVRRRLFEVFTRPSTFRCFPEVQGVLASLRHRGIRLGIVSNWSPRLGMIVRGLGLDGAVSFVLASGEIEIEKPDAGIFHLALRHAGVRAREALHVGDNPRADVCGARRAGLGAVLLDRRAARPRGGDAVREGAGGGPGDGVPVIAGLEGLLPLLPAGGVAGPGGERGRT